MTVHVDNQPNMEEKLKNDFAALEKDLKNADKLLDGLDHQGADIALRMAQIRLNAIGVKQTSIREDREASKSWSGYATGVYYTPTAGQVETAPVTTIRVGTGG